MRKKFILSLLIAVAGIIIYSNTVGAPFIWDDLWLIYDNPRIRDLSIFTNISGTRYLTFLSFALNYRINGYDVTGYHIFNIAVHLLNAMLVYFLVLYIFSLVLQKRGIVFSSSHKLALLSGLLFASHPVYTQAVTYISQRSVLLATFFYLLSLLMYIKARLSSQLSNGKTSVLLPASIGYYSLSFVSAVLAMKCKEISFTLPVIILLFEYYFFKDKLDIKKSLIYAVPLLLTMLIIPLDKPQQDVFGRTESGIFKIEDKSVVSGLEANRLSKISRVEYMLTQFRVIVTYIRLFFFPVNLNFDYDYPIYHSMFTPQVFLSLLFLLAILALGINLFYRSRSAVHGSQFLALRLSAFGIFWFLITLSVESFIVVLNDIIFEYRLYLPSLGIILALTGFAGYANMRLKNTYRYLEVVAIIIIVIFSILTYMRNEVLKNKISLWEDVAMKNPYSARSHDELGNAYSEQNRIDEAIQQYLAALELKPDFARAHHNLGSAYHKQGLLNKAIEEYLKALKLKPNMAMTHNNLGFAYHNVGLIDKAIAEYRIAIELSPDTAKTHYNLGLAYRQKGLINEAIKEFETALKIQPGFLPARQSLESLKQQKT